MKKFLAALLAMLLLLNMALPTVLAEEVADVVEDVVITEDVVEEEPELPAEPEQTEEAERPEAPGAEEPEEEDVITDVIPELPTEEAEEEIPMLPTEDLEAREEGGEAAKFTMKDVKWAKQDDAGDYWVLAGKALTLTGNMTFTAADVEALVEDYESGSSTPLTKDVGTFKVSKSVLTFTPSAKLTVEKIVDLNVDPYNTVYVHVIPVPTKVQLYADRTMLGLNKADEADYGAVLYPYLLYKTEDGHYNDECPLYEDGPVTWTIPKNAAQLATVEVNGGIVTISKPIKAGSLTFKAVANDGSGKSASIKVQIVDAVATDVAIVDAPKAVAVGKTAKMAAVLTPEKPKNKTLVWSLAGEDDAKYASITPAGVLKGIAKGTVTVHVENKNDSSVCDEVEVEVKPAATGITITAPADANIKTTGKVNAYEIDDAAEDLLKFTATVTPADASRDVVWKTSNAKIAVVNSDGEVTFTQQCGKVKITATTTDGTKKTASYELTVGALADTLAITATNATVAEHDDTCDVAFTALGGKKISLKAVAGRTDGVKPTDKCGKVTYKLVGSNEYATITDKGVLTTKAVTTDTPVRIEANDGSLSADILVTLKPATTAVKFFGLNEMEADSNTLNLNYDADAEYKVTFKTTPEGNGLTYKTSNKKIADVDAYGNLTLNGTMGDVTITATSADGTKKSATVKLKVQRYADAIEIVSDAKVFWPVDDPCYQVMGGSKVTFKAELSREDGTRPVATNIVWSVDDCNTGLKATIKDGVLTIPAVTEETQIKVIAKQEGVVNGEVKGVALVSITPAVESVEIIAPDGMTYTSEDGQSYYDIDLTTYDNDDGCIFDEENVKVLPANALQEVVWTSSNDKIAYIDVDMLQLGGATGSVTITATAMDGSKKFDSITFNVIIPATVVDITCTGAQEAPEDETEYDYITSSGESITLKATVDRDDDFEPTFKTVDWSVDICENPDIQVSISSSGVVKIPTVTEDSTLRVVAMAKDRTTGMSAFKEILILVNPQ